MPPKKKGKAASAAKGETFNSRGKLCQVIGDASKVKDEAPKSGHGKGGSKGLHNAGKGNSKGGGKASGPVGSANVAPPPPPPAAGNGSLKEKTLPLPPGTLRHHFSPPLVFGACGVYCLFVLVVRSSVGGAFLRWRSPQSRCNIICN